MKVNITARKFKAHSTLKEFIETEISNLTHYYDNIVSADVKLSYQNTSNSVKTAEVIIKVPGQLLTATENSDEFKKSISLAVEKLNRQLDKLKTKRIKHI